MTSPAPLTRTAVAGRIDLNVLLGVGFMCLAGTLFPVMNGIVQVLSRDFSSEQIIWARTTGHLLIVLAVIVPRYGRRVLRTKQPFVQMARSIMLLLSTALFFFAVKDVPLGKAGAITVTAPFFVAMMAWPLLGERLNPARLAAVLVGFAGALVVIRPGTEVFQWASVLIVGCAAAYALYQVYTRRVAGIDRPETSVMYSALVGTVVMTLVVPFAWTTPTDPVHVALMVATGALGAVGHYCVARALTYAQANVVAPFQYWQVVGSVIVGYLLSGTLPDAWTWTGAAIIVSAGVYIAVTETRRKVPSPVPLRGTGSTHRVEG